MRFCVINKFSGELRLYIDVDEPGLIPESTLTNFEKKILKNKMCVTLLSVLYLRFLILPCIG